MTECPNCFVPLVKKRTPNGYVYICRMCKGRSAALPVLRKAGASRTFLADVWQRSRAEHVEHRRRCPHCLRPMAEITASESGQSLLLDVCNRCAAIWFDAGELKAIPRSSKPPVKHPENEMSPEAREQLAMYRIKTMKEQAKREGFDDGPDAAWQWLPAILGMPVELDAPAVSRTPWMTWGTIVLCILATLPVFGADLLALRRIFDEWGFIAAQWGRAGGLTMLSSFFLHGGIWHLVGNMYFLFVFGDNVEDRVGRIGLVGLLLAAHLCGIAAQGLFGPDPTVPCVGASAGISGVIAFYAVEFPKARIGFLFRIFVMFRWFHMSAIGALVLYVLVQLFGAYMQIQGFGSVSYLGHLGGLVVGMAAALWYRACRRHETSQATGMSRRFK